MKNNKLKILAVLPLMGLLAACNSNEVKAGGEVPAGKEITAQQLKVKAQKCEEAMTKVDALGFNLEGASYHLNKKSEQKLPGESGETSIKYESNVTIDNVALEGAATGLTSTNIDDVKGYGLVGAEYSSSTLYQAGAYNKKFAIPEAKLSLGSYTEGNTTYLDLSDSNLKATISSKVGEEKEIGKYQGDFSFGDKVSFDNGLEKKELPLFSEIELDDFVNDFSETIEKIASQGGTLKALEHDDGTYSYSVDVTGLKDAKNFEDEFGIDKDDFDKEFTIPGWNTKATSTLDVNKYALAIIFDETGVKSIGITLDVSYSFVMNWSVNGITFSSTASVDYDFNAKVNFQYGADVTVKEVTDKESYTKLPTTIDYDDWIELITK